MAGGISFGRVRLPFLAALIAVILVALGGVSFAQEAAPVSFGKGSLAGEISNNPTSLEFGPDGRLYVAQQNGVVNAYTIGRGGPSQYQATATETINLINSIPNHNDNGNVNTGVGTRQVTGVLTAGTAQKPVLYVSSGDPRIGAGPNTGDINLDTNSGVISRLTKTSSGWNKLDLVRGLPRSEENHSPNGMQLSADGNTLYLAQGGTTNQGAPSNNFALLPETALSAAILEINLAAIGNATYDLPTLNDEDRSGGNDANDPFGGNDGKNQAKLVSGGPVQVYAPGFRNPFDLVIAESGKMYTIDNGGNAGWGDIPENEGPNGNCTNAVQEPGETNQDNFHHIDGKGYYGGHPNPTRANKSNTFNASNPQSPVGTANPIECDYDKPAGGTLTTFPASTNGIVEYTASDFGGAMEGDLLAAGFDNNIYRIELNAAGDAPAEKPEALFSSVGLAPLDVAAQGDDDPFPGTIWAADIFSSDIVVFEPFEPDGACDVSSPSGDADGDGYKNQDEIDNGTDPCSPADMPPDRDEDNISDKNDPDDDNDGIPDTEDPFPIDPDNGMSTGIPKRIDWDNDTTGGEGGIANTGFTGLMTNGKADYQNLYDPSGMTVGGAGGLLTVDEVSGGDAIGSVNSQENAFQFGFQFGVNPADNSRVFTAKTRILAPFAGMTPENYQSMGIFLGTGDQDNYVKLATSANGGQGGIEFGKEINGAFETSPQPTVPMPGPDYVDLYLTVDPDAGTVQPSYVTSANDQQGQHKYIGEPYDLPASWLDGSEALAVGVISTSIGTTNTFPASWDFIEVVYGDGTPSSEPSELAAEPDSVDFGGVKVGESASKDVTLTNTGTQQDIEINSVEVSGADAAAFDHDFSTALTLKPGESATLNVAFSPLGDGAKSAAIAIEHDGSNAPLGIPLSGEGNSPNALYRVNAGGPAIAGDPGWSVDTGANPSPYGNGIQTGNWIASTGNAIDMSHPSIPADTPEKMFQSERWDAPEDPDLAWQFPVEPGSYEVRLYFAETYDVINAPGGRVFDVSIEGAAVLDGYDVFAESGGLYKGVVETFTVQSDGALNIDFAHDIQNPAVKGIEILPASASGDPSGKWRSLAPSSANRQEVSYVEAGGKLYLAGGSASGLHERYDPETNSWSTVKPLPVPSNSQLDHIQGVELGGKIYYIGGLKSFPGPHSSAMYIYDPATNTFSTGTPMPDGRGRGAGGLAVHNGKIYYAGGLHDGEAVAWFDVYNPATGNWTRLPDMPRVRDHFHAAVVDGKFYAIAGRDTLINATNDKVDVYKLSAGSGGSWQTRNTALPTARGGFAAAVLGKEILIIGGEGGGNAYDDVEAYDTTSNSWRALAPMPTARHGIQAAVCNGGVYIAAGGKVQSGGGQTNVHEAFFLNGPTTCESANEPPTLNTIGSQSVAEGAQKTIEVAASDPDGDAVALSASNLPNFATFTDNGGGKGTLKLAPQSGAAGEYQVTVTASDGKSFDSEAFKVTVTAASGYSVKTSKSSDRSSPTSLGGATVSGKIYPFTSPDSGVKQVAFYLDNPNMSGSPNQVENVAPYDFAGGSVATAVPFDTMNVANGSHAITAKFTLSDNTTKVISATFTVDNSGAQSANALSASAESLDFEDVEVGGDESRSILLTNTGGEGVTIQSAGLGGSNAGEFELQALGSVTLAPDEAMPFEVSFKPRDAGGKSAKVVVDHNRSGTPLEIRVSGNGKQVETPDTGKPVILRTAPRSGARIKLRRPDITAIVRDGESELNRSDIELSLDGEPVAFSYNPRNDKLLYKPRPLSFGNHVVRVAATDAAENRQEKTWSFKVVKARR